MLKAAAMGTAAKAAARAEMDRRMLSELSITSSVLKYY